MTPYLWYYIGAGIVLVIGSAILGVMTSTQKRKEEEKPKREKRTLEKSFSGPKKKQARESKEKKVPSRSNSTEQLPATTEKSSDLKQETKKTTKKSSKLSPVTQNEKSQSIHVQPVVNKETNSTPVSLIQSTPSEMPIEPEPSINQTEQPPVEDTTNKEDLIHTEEKKEENNQTEVPQRSESSVKKKKSKPKKEEKKNETTIEWKDSPSELSKQTLLASEGSFNPDQQKDSTNQQTRKTEENNQLKAKIRELEQELKSEKQNSQKHMKEKKTLEIQIKAQDDKIKQLMKENAMLKRTLSSPKLRPQQAAQPGGDLLSQMNYTLKKPSIQEKEPTMQSEMNGVHHKPEKKGSESKDQTLMESLQAENEYLKAELQKLQATKKEIEKRINHDKVSIKEQKMNHATKTHQHEQVFQPDADNGCSLIDQFLAQSLTK